MKRTMRYSVNGKQVERVINYIPVRYIFAVLITLLEVLAMIGTVVLCCYYIPYFYLAAFATEVFCVIRIIASDDNPDYKIPWLLFVLILPIAGFMLYFIFYSRKLQKKFIRRLEELRRITYPEESDALLSELSASDPQAHGEAAMLCRIADAHVFKNTSTTYYPLGEEMHAALLRDLENSQSFIYMEYFIIEEGEFWGSILNILKEKAAAGLDVRVLYDDIGCMSTLPGNYAKRLAADGIRATPFSRLRGNADSEFNNRSHRKITVIDGRIGYTGGVNIADEYINRVERFGHWKDVGLRLEGEGVRELCRLFLIDYGLNVRMLPETTVDPFPRVESRGRGYVIPFGDGPRPLYKRRVAQSLISTMLADARSYAWITTPYLIIDNGLCQDLETAALRGVDVRLVLPHIPDKKMVFEMTRSFYPRLLSAGVRIFEYEPGFVHAKTYLFDDRVAMVGTVNLDYRSLVHHFENGVWMLDTDCIGDIRRDLDDTISRSIEVTAADIRTSIPKRMFRAVVRIFAPLL